MRSSLAAGAVAVAVLAAGIRWAIDQRLNVVNLSLGTTKQEYFGLFHELADAAYFRNVLLVTAANNLPAVSFPSLYAAVASVACHEGRDPYEFYYNGEPPVEFWAPASIDDPTILGANGPVTIRLTLYYETAAGTFQSIVVQQVQAGG